MRPMLNEALPAMIPEYPVTIAGQKLTLRFDVNINKTKKGIKLQFVMPEVPQDPRQAQQLANELGTELQERFAAANMQVVYDVENPYKNVIGFLLPLPSLANSIIKNVFQGNGEKEGRMVPKEPAQNDKEQEPAEELPAQELPPAEEPIREWLKKMAGL